MAGWHKKFEQFQKMWSYISSGFALKKARTELSVLFRMLLKIQP